MDFYKYHALGNDYIIIDPQKVKLTLNEENIKLICHRNYGIGSDGILYGPILSNGEIFLRIFNPDGGEAEKSGNGLRMFSKYLIDSGYINKNSFIIKTKGGSVSVEILDRKPSLIKIDMGTVTFKSDEIPVAGKNRDVINEPLEVNGTEYNITCLSIGNPHCVIVMNDISEEKAKQLGPYVENNELFPKRINMQLMKQVDRNNINIEIWERGAGYTLASGSSSCAAASAAYKLGLVDRNIRVNMPGGYLDIEIDEGGHVHMLGPAESVAEGNFTQEFLSKIL